LLFNFCFEFFKDLAEKGHLRAIIDI